MIAMGIASNTFSEGKGCCAASITRDFSVFEFRFLGFDLPALVIIDFSSIHMSFFSSIDEQGVQLPGLFENSDNGGMKNRWAAPDAPTFSNNNTKTAYNSPNLYHIPRKCNDLFVTG